MTFEVTQKTLEGLDWGDLRSRLEAHARTPIAKGRLQTGDIFEASQAGVHARLEETGEARGLLAEGLIPPLENLRAQERSLARLRKGGALGAAELLDLCATLTASRETQSCVQRRAELVPRLTELSERLGDHSVLEERIQKSIDDAGEVRDAASQPLAAARREARQLSAELQKRLDGILKNPTVAACLQDSYFTVRNDRYVLPVRAEARRNFKGIVHDASGSGTTVFMEPEALVEINNHHKRIELEIERESKRVLRDISKQASAHADGIESDLEILAQIDLAFARARLAEEQDSVEPEVGDEGVIRLFQARHPSLPLDRAVPNDLQLGDGYQVLVISGPNAGGKTVAMKSVALAALCVRAGLHVAAAPGARVDLFDRVLADIGDEQSIGENLSTFSAHMANVAQIVDAASPRTLVVLDEIGAGTDPSEGAALAQGILESLADAGARVIATTHFGLLKEMADADTRFANASVDFDPDTLAPTYRLRVGLPGTSSATAVAARMGLHSDVVERARGILEREDRQMDRMLADLNASRAALENEKREAERLARESESARAEYRGRLERLQERRDNLYHSMRKDLDQAFQEAHGQIATVIRNLQRGGSAQAAAQARKDLQAVETQSQSIAPERGISSAPAESLETLDWSRARPGDTVGIRGGTVGVLEALPDRRGRVAVGVGGRRVLLPVEQVGAAKPAKRTPSSKTAPDIDSGSEPTDPDGVRCDLRGLRVEEALDRLDAALDRATLAGRYHLQVIHGVGSGALRRAVREHLVRSEYVETLEEADPDGSGDGISVARLRA